MTSADFINGGQLVVTRDGPYVVTVGQSYAGLSPLSRAVVVEPARPAVPVFGQSASWQDGPPVVISAWDPDTQSWVSVTHSFVGLAGTPTGFTNAAGQSLVVNDAENGVEFVWPNPFDVRNFGAVGDGTADDTAAIDAARTAALASKGIVYFPPGQYRYPAGGLVMAANERWAGVGAGSGAADAEISQLLFENTTGSAVTLNDYCRLSDLRFTGEGTTGTIGLDVSATAARGQISRCRTEAFGEGIHFDNAWIWTIEDCYVFNNIDMGIRVGTTSLALTITGGEIAGNPVGIEIEYAANLTLSGVTIEANSVAGIRTSTNLAKAGVSIGSCYFEANSGHDILFTGAQNFAPEISGSFFSSSTPVHIELAGTEAAIGATGTTEHGVDDCQIHGNTFIGGSATTAILVANADAHRTVVGPNAYGAYGGQIDPFDIGVHDWGTDTVCVDREQTANLVVNGDMEGPGGGVGLSKVVDVPSGWEAFQSSGTYTGFTVSVDPVAPRSGFQSAKVDNNAGPVAGPRIRQDIPVVIGESYRVSGWLKASGSTQVNFQVGDTASSISHARVFVPDDSTWTFVESGVFVADESVCRVTFTNSGPAAACDFWVDDVRMTRVGEPLAAPVRSFGSAVTVAGSDGLGHALTVDASGRLLIDGTIVGTQT